MTTKTTKPPKAGLPVTPKVAKKRLKPRPGARKGGDLGDATALGQVELEGPISPFREGVNLADAEGDPEAAAAKAAESAHAKALLKEIEEAREFDKAMYAGMAKDRLYAAMKAPWRIKVALIQTYIDLWVAILYARDPQAQVMPSEAVSERGRATAREYAKTLEIVVKRLIKRGALKRSAKKWVRSALTVGVGVLRANWMERMGQDPVVKAKLDDIQDNLRQLAVLREGLEEGTGPYTDAECEEQEIKALMKSLEANIEKVMSRGMVYDFIPLQDLTVSKDVDAWTDYLDSPWLDTRYFKSTTDACKMFPGLTKEKIESCANFRRDPEPEENRRPATTQSNAKDADSYTYSASSANSGKCDYVCIHEMQHRDDGVVYTLIEGLDGYARPPEPPKPFAPRFYDLFLLWFTETEGRRVPESLNTRSHSLQDEYMRTRSKLSIHRDRIIPKIIFNKAKLDKGSATAIARSVVGEMVGVKVNANIDLAKLLWVPSYPQIDGSLYDVTPTKLDLELIWGTQEAVMGPIQQAKTATEAKIQESGTQARSTSKRDMLDDCLTEVCEYTAIMAIQALDQQDVRDIAGEKALWLQPEEITPDTLDTLVNVDVKGGSSGKPDTLAEIEQWEKEMGVLVDAIQQIGTLRNSSPLDVADCLEAVVEETFTRYGDRVDLSRFIPSIPAPPEIDPMTGIPVTMPGMADIAAGAQPGMPIPAGPMPAAPGDGSVPGGEAPPLAPERPHPATVDAMV